MCPQKPSIKDDDDHDDDEKQEDIECTVEWTLFFLSASAFVDAARHDQHWQRAQPKPQLIMARSFTIAAHRCSRVHHVMTTERRLVMDCVSLSQSERRPLDIRRR